MSPGLPGQSDMERAGCRWAHDYTRRRLEWIVAFLVTGFVGSRLMGLLIPMSSSGWPLVLLISLAPVCVTVPIIWAQSRHEDRRLRGMVLTRMALGLAFSIGWILDVPSQIIEHQWHKATPSSIVIRGNLEREGRTWLLHDADQRRTFRLQAPADLTQRRLHDGDAAVVTGRALPPAVVRNPGSFDERTWMKQKGWALIVSVERMHVVHHHAISGVGSAHWREALRSRIDSRFEHDEVRALVRAMVLADRSALGSDLESTFRRVGLMHLLAVSGLHFGCIILGVWLLAGSVVSRIPVPPTVRRTTIAGLVLLAALGYAELVDWTPSVVRAFLMLSVASVCRMAQRRGWIERSLLISALYMAFIQPEQWYSVGTQLSFAAVAGIALGLRFDRWAKTSGSRRRLPFQSALVVSSAAFAGTLPVLLWQMGWVPLMGLFASPPAIAMTTATLLLTIASIVMPLGGHAVGMLASTGMQVIILMAEQAGSAGFPRLLARSHADVAAALMLVSMGALWALSRWRLYWKVCATTLLVSGALLIWTRPTSPSLMMLDAGQGDALILEGKGFIPVVIDTGPGGRSGRALAGALQSHGHEQARVMLTHGDRDHTGGLKFMSDEIQIRSVMAPWTPSTLLTPDVLEGTQPVRLARGMRMSLPASVRGYVLHPATPGRDNHHSLVVLLVRGRDGILLTGDVDVRAEKELAERYGPLFETLDARILKVAHHGSNTSTNAEFLKHFLPDVALISAGVDNQFGHPDPEVLNRLEASGAIVLQTSQQGAIRISGWGKHIRIHEYRDGRWRHIPLQ